MPQAPVDLAQRPLVFTHIPKTAGTTINVGLRQVFADAAVFHLQRLEKDELRTLAADRGIQAYAGHLPFCQAAPAFAGSGRHPAFITVLRDPMERVLSAYSYAKGTPGERWHDLASRLDIDAFIAHMKKREPQFLVGKQCRFLCPKGQADADSAFGSLKENFALVGLQQDLGSFFHGIERLTGRQLPQPKRRNQSADRVQVESLSADTLKTLGQTMAADLQLYERTLAWLKERG